MKKKSFIYKIKPLSRLLFEQEEEEDVFADEGGEDADTDEGGEDVDTDEGGDGADADVGEDDADEPAEDEPLDVDLDDEVKLSKSIDHDLEALLIDFETDARKSVQFDDKNTIEIEESLNLGMLIEQDEPEYEADIDLERFTSEVARLVKNYTNLLDMEKMLVAKAREFIASRYGEKAEGEMVNILDNQHNIIIDQPDSQDTPDEFTPIAAGAGTGAAAGAE